MENFDCLPHIKLSIIYEIRTERAQLLPKKACKSHFHSAIFFNKNAGFNQAGKYMLHLNSCGCIITQIRIKYDFVRILDVNYQPEFYSQLKMCDNNKEKQIDAAYKAMYELLQESLSDQHYFTTKELTAKLSISKMREQDDKGIDKALKEAEVYELSKSLNVNKKKTYIGINHFSNMNFILTTDKLLVKGLCKSKTKIPKVFRPICSSQLVALHRQGKLCELVNFIVCFRVHSCYVRNRVRVNKYKHANFQINTKDFVTKEVDANYTTFIDKKEFEEKTRCQVIWDDSSSNHFLQLTKDSMSNTKIVIDRKQLDVASSDSARKFYFNHLEIEEIINNNNLDEDDDVKMTEDEDGQSHSYGHKFEAFDKLGGLLVKNEQTSKTNMYNGLPDEMIVFPVERLFVMNMTDTNWILELVEGVHTSDEAIGTNELVLLKSALAVCKDEVAVQCVKQIRETILQTDDETENKVSETFVNT